MIRLTFLLRHRPELTLDEFQDYWRRKHGPLVASLGEALHARRYVQVHTLDDPVNAEMAAARGGMELPYSGVAEIWWDNWAQLKACMTSESGREAGAALLEDEAHFIDLPNSPLWLAYEYPQINPVSETLVARPRNPYVKLYYPLRHAESLELDEAQHYWHTHHGPIIRAHAAASGVLKYIQVHRCEHPLEASLRKVRGTVVEPYTGHAELWLDRRLQRGRTTPEAKEAGRRAIEDESTFVDFKRSGLWVAKEHVFIDHT
ncbi:MAG: EthD domain-containing protein [Gammaproteobacteria bacterium]|nr:EthD domain-containing protein [Gammaproteobacteria bacterium]